MKKQSWRISAVFGAGIALSAFMLAVVFPFSADWELKSRDFRHFLRGPNSVDTPVVIVAIDDASFEKINIRWPWPRSVLATGIDRLAAEGAQVIGLDIMLGDADYVPEEDYILAEAIRRAGNVIIPVKRDVRQSGEYRIDYYDLPLPEFLEVSAGSGYVNFPLDSDGTVRRVVPFDSTFSPTSGSGQEQRRNAFGLQILNFLTIETDSNRKILFIPVILKIPSVPFLRS